MSDRLTRRQLIVAGVALVIAGCGRGSPRATSRTAPPPYDLGPGVPPARPQPAAGGLWYQVVPGDTLSSIARRSTVEVDAIAESNGLTTAQLTPGQRLWLPGAAALGDDPLARQGGAHEAEPVEVDEAATKGGYRLVPRSEWTRNAVRGNNQAMGGVHRITIHHTGEHAGLEGIPEVDVLRRIERYHQQDRGWAAIGYHYIVGKSGKVYEGRPAKFQGAHVSGANEHNLGISVVGDFMHKLPNQRQLAALDSFLTDMRMRYRVGKSRVYGHRDLGKSECCGDSLYRWLRAYRG